MLKGTRHKGAALAVVALLAAGCGDDSATSVVDDTTPPIETTSTGSDVAGTSNGELGERTTREIYDITFDGSECTTAEPIEVQPGDYAFVLTDESDFTSQTTPDPNMGEGATKPVTLWPGVRALKEGYTYQDILAYQEQAGGSGSHWDAPFWAANSAPLDPDPPMVELADNELLFTAVLEPGSYYVAVAVTTNPTQKWLCTSVDVVAA